MTQQEAMVSIFIDTLNNRTHCRNAGSFSDNLEITKSKFYRAIKNLNYILSTRYGTEILYDKQQGYKFIKPPILGM